jgi:protein involved in polysaccharide export with SLBB domain
MQYDMSHLVRIIAINLPKLHAGDPRMNIIIRNNDIIHVPPLQVGEFYVMGEVLRPGVYSLTGRKVTAKMAVAAAGNLGPMSWPNNSILIRRVARDQEQTIPLPLNDIFAGREPDVFLKPDDVIAVGSHWSAPFLAVWRNAFRMTYGFGFIYDRNYSEMEFEVPLLFPCSHAR